MSNIIFFWQFKNIVGTLELEGTLILQKGETKASPLLALGPAGENHYRHGLRSRQGQGYPCSATPSPNWPGGLTNMSHISSTPRLPHSFLPVNTTCPTPLSLHLLSSRPTPAVGSEKSPAASPTGN